jgi:hypothetical protein
MSRIDVLGNIAGLFDSLLVSFFGSMRSWLLHLYTLGL